MTRQKIIKEIEDVNTLNRLDLTDLPRTFYPTTAEHTFLHAHGAAFWIGHILGHKTSLDIFKNQNHTKYVLRPRNKSGKFVSMWKFNKTVNLKLVKLS